MEANTTREVAAVQSKRILGRKQFQWAGNKQNKVKNHYLLKTNEQVTKKTKNILYYLNFD